MLPDHYGWKVPSRLNAIEAEYRSLERYGAIFQRQPAMDDLRRDARAIIDSLDPDGRWISTFSGEPLYGQPKFKTGDRYVNSAVFSDNLQTLASFVAFGADVCDGRLQTRMLVKLEDDTLFSSERTGTPTLPQGSLDHGGFNPSNPNRHSAQRPRALLVVRCRDGKIPSSHY